MVNYKATSAIGIAILILVATLGYNLTEFSYYCDNEPEKLIECNYGISGGLGTRCYLNEEHNRWDYCKTGWERVMDHIEISFDSISAFEFENIKDYNAETKEITISDTFLKLWTTNEVARYKLLENTDVCVYNCYAIGSATLNEKGRLFDDRDFIDDKEINVALNNKIYISNNRELKTRTFISTETICKDKIEFSDCIKEDVIVEEEYYEYNWVEYNGEVVEPNSYYWKLEASKDAEQSVDWAVSMFGISLEEVREDWAWWIGTAPDLYWKLNEASGNALDSSGNSVTLTNTGITYAAGKLNNAASSDGADRNLLTTTTTTFTTNDFTIAYWIKSSDAATGIVYGDNDAWTTVTTFGSSLNGGGAGKIDFQWSGGTLQSAQTDLNNGSWHRVVVVREGLGAGELKMYIDGDTTPDATTTANVDFTAQGWMLFDNVGVAPFEGSIDDFQVFNGLAWTTGDVTEDWNNGLGKEGEVVDPRFANATLSFPANATNFTIPNPTLGCNFTGSPQNNITDVQVLVYDSADNLEYDSTESGLESISYNKTNWQPNLPEVDSYYWSCFMLGDGGLNASTMNWTFNILLNISGYVLDANGDFSEATIGILNQTSNKLVANVSTNGSGFYSYGPLDSGNYTVFAYNESNFSRGGDIKPHVIIP